MAQLTENLGSKYCEKYGAIQTYQIGGSCHIYAGATVVLNLYDGYVYPALDATDATRNTVVHKDLVVGVAQEELNNSDNSKSGSARNIRVRRDSKVLRTINGSWTPNGTDQPVGKLACVYDDQTVQLFSGVTPMIVCGRITEIIDNNTVWVDYSDRPQRTTSNVLD